MTDISSVFKGKKNPIQFQGFQKASLPICSFCTLKTLLSLRDVGFRHKTSVTCNPDCGRDKATRRQRRRGSKAEVACSSRDADAVSQFRRCSLHRLHLQARYVTRSPNKAVPEQDQTKKRQGARGGGGLNWTNAISNHTNPELKIQTSTDEN